MRCDSMIVDSFVTYSLHYHTNREIVERVVVACVNRFGGLVPFPSSTTTMPITNHHHNNLHTPLRSTPSSSSSNSFTSKILLLLTLLPVSLATIAFILQWRGGITDPSTLLSPHGSHRLPGTGSSHLSPLSHSRSSDCLNLARSSSPSFPYYHNWKLDFGDSLTPKVRFLCSFLWFENWAVLIFCCNFKDWLLVDFDWFREFLLTLMFVINRSSVRKYTSGWQKTMCWKLGCAYFCNCWKPCLW